MDTVVSSSARFDRPRRMLAAAILCFVAGCAQLPPTDEQAKLTGYFPRPEALHPDAYDLSRAAFRATCAHQANALQAPADTCKARAVAMPASVDPGACDATAGKHDLTIDHALFSRGGTRLLVIQSGVHGAEGPAGAAVQLMVMEHYLQPLLTAGIDVYVIHAFNPYGFKAARRTDACNVNLNRHFLLPTADVPGSEAYLRYQTLFEGGGPVTAPYRESLGLQAAVLAAVIADGFNADANNAGFNTGQYVSPRGINYGGDRSLPAPQHAFLDQDLRPLLNGGRYEQVLFLDYHTGLGESGFLSIILGKEDSPAAAGGPVLEKPRARALADAMGLHDGALPGIGLKSAQDYFATQGDIVDYVPTLAGDHRQDVTAVTMEYGTLGDGALAGLRSLARMALENRAHFHGCGDRTEACAEVRADSAELFNPTDPDWRLRVLCRSATVFGTLARRWGDPSVAVEPPAACRDLEG